MRLSVRTMAATVSVMMGGGLFGITWWIIFFEGATHDPTFIGMIYRGYTISPVGSFIGLLWGLVDGYICGMIFAWLYNYIFTRIPHKAMRTSY